MQTLEYRTMDKSKWKDGPWQNEPDKKQWLDSETGMPCLIIRNNVGALCGYVGVAKNHPLFGLDYDKSHPCLVELWEQAKSGTIGKRGIFTLIFASSEENNTNPRIDMVFDVHGSLTFSGACMKHNPAYPNVTPEILESEGICHLVEDGEDDNVWWFGFDCGHCDDWSPKLYGEEPQWQQYYGKDMIYRDIDYVTAEVQSLAKQLKAVA